MADLRITVRVESYAGHRGEQEPRRFFLDGRSVEVTEVLDRWLAPDHRYFKLRDPGGATWILRHEESTGDWELTMYERPPDLRRKE